VWVENFELVWNYVWMLSDLSMMVEVGFERRQDRSRHYRRLPRLSSRLHCLTFFCFIYELMVDEVMFVWLEDLKSNFYSLFLSWVAYSVLKR